MSAVFYLAWVIAIVLVVVGIYALVAPRTLARGYGVAVEGTRRTATFARPASAMSLWVWRLARRHTSTICRS